MAMRIAVVSILPPMFDAVTQYGVSSRAVSCKAVELTVFNPRDYAEDAHRTVDYRPYGGGPGMVMAAPPVVAAIQAAKLWCESADFDDGSAEVVYLSPQGRDLTQSAIDEWAVRSRPLVLLCGRYEGLDERVIDRYVDTEISLGDFVMSGGELGAMAIFDAVVRRLPGVLGHPLSAEQDSFQGGLLDCPHYTRPEVFEGQEVPAVLKSGHHGDIRQWRQQQAEERTRLRRPDLWKKWLEGQD